MFALCLLSLLHTGASAQFSTAIPVRVINPNHRYSYSRPEEQGEEQDAIRANFPQAQWPLVYKGLKRLSEPKGYEYDTIEAHLADMSLYKAYIIAKWKTSRMRNGMVMIWLPVAENAHMPEVLRPVEAPGILLVMTANSPGFAYINKSDEPAAPPVKTTSSAYASLPARMAGTLAIGYGTEGGKMKVYYLYEVYSRGMVDGTALVAKLKQETKDMHYVMHKFYPSYSYSPVIKMFKEDGGRKAKRADWRYGGSLDEDGNSSWQVRTPQNPEYKMTTSRADMSQYTTTGSSGVSGYSADPQQPAKAKSYKKCTYCNGKGYITVTTTTKSTVGGVGTVGSTGYVDWERAPTTVTHQNKDKKTCEFCKGTGEVEK